MSKRLVFVFALSLAACKPESPPPPAKPDLGPEAAAIQAELPEAMKGKLEFVQAEFEDGDVFGLIPKDWKRSEFIPDMFEPAGGDEFGPEVSMWIGTNCDGTCTAKDWKAVADKVEFGSYNEAPFSKERDEPLGDGGRLVVYVGNDEVHIRVAWWKTDWSRYLNCRVDLDANWAPAKDAFVRACLATKLRDWL